MTAAGLGLEPRSPRPERDETTNCSTRQVLQIFPEGKKVLKLLDLSLLGDLYLVSATVRTEPKFGQSIVYDIQKGIISVRKNQLVHAHRLMNVGTSFRLVKTFKKGHQEFALRNDPFRRPDSGETAIPVRDIEAFTDVFFDIC